MASAIVALICSRVENEGKPESSSPRVFPLSNKKLNPSQRKAQLLSSGILAHSTAWKKVQRAFRTKVCLGDPRTLNATGQPRPVSSDLIKVFTLQVTLDVMEEFNYCPKSHKQVAYFIVSTSEFNCLCVWDAKKKLPGMIVCAVRPCTQGGCWQISRNRRPAWSFPIVIG